MAAIIPSGANGATGSATLTGNSRVIISGVFSGARVSLTIEEASLGEAPLYSFTQKEAIELSAVNGDTLRAYINGGDTNTSITVAVAAL